MKTINLFFMLFVLTGMAFSCSDNNDETFTPKLEAKDLPATFTTPETACDTFILLSSNVDWKASTETSWITLKSTEGTAADNYKFEFSLTENPELTARPGKIEIVAKDYPANKITITLNQEGIKLIPALSITDPVDKIINLQDFATGEHSFSISSNVTWKAEVTSTPKWITLTTVEGSGDGEIQFTVDANDGEAREGTISISYTKNAEIKDILTVKQPAYIDYAARDKEAMLAILDNISFDNPYYARSWKVDKPIKEWDYLTVDDNGRVTAINFEGNLTGELILPEEIGNLTALKTLDLSYFGVSGEIPASLGNLTQLEVLKLNDNKLTGEIPATLAKLTKLTTLTLNNKNKLTGCIPVELAKFKETINPQQGATWRDEILLEVCE